MAERSRFVDQQPGKPGYRRWRVWQKAPTDDWMLVLLSWQSQCESFPRSLDECWTATSGRWPLHLIGLSCKSAYRHRVAPLCSAPAVHRGVSTGGIWGIYTPKIIQVNFLLGRNDLRMAIKHEYWSFIPPKKILYPQNKFLATSLAVHHMTCYK